MYKQISKGFTLIEVMIVVAIIAIIASIALPNYQEYIKSSRRGAASTCMLEMAGQMERRYTASLVYDSTTTLPAVACTTGITEYYSFSFRAGEPTPRTYVLRATPLGGQEDDCGTLILDQKTRKGAADNFVDAALIKKCWK
jgi:type IV pilus assembly protein PilE